MRASRRWHFAPGTLRRRGPIALNPDRVGHAYPSYTYEVSREKLREYAEATGQPDPALRADPADVPLEELEAPPTFAACFCLGRLSDLLSDPELGAHPNLVHSSQTFTYQRPVRGGDVLRCTPRIADITSRRRMDLLTYDVECVDAGSGESVLSSRSVLIFFPSEGEEGA